MEKKEQTDLSTIANNFYQCCDCKFVNVIDISAQQSEMVTCSGCNRKNKLSTYKQLFVNDNCGYKMKIGDHYIILQETPDKLGNTITEIFNMMFNHINSLEKRLQEIEKKNEY